MAYCGKASMSFKIDSQRLEDLYAKANFSTNHDRKATFMPGSYYYTLDFKSFTQTNENTAKVRKIRRRRPASSSSRHMNIAQTISSKICYPSWFSANSENPKATMLEVMDDTEHFSILNKFLSKKCLM